MGRGVSGDFVKEVEAKLPPGRSALFLIVKSMDDDAAMAAFRDFRGDLIQSTLSTEEEEAIRQTLHSTGGTRRSRRGLDPGEDLGPLRLVLLRADEVPVSQVGEARQGGRGVR